MRYGENYSLQRTAAASALLVVLWVVALLSFMVTTALMVVRQHVEIVNTRHESFRARQLAEMGVAVAAHPGVKATEPLLRKRLSQREWYETLITTEEARLPFRTLLQEQHRRVLERILVGWKLKPIEAEAFVDALMDWQDADDLVRLKGAERAHYAEAGFSGHPFNRPFESTHDIARVAGADRLAEVKPDWADWVTFRGNGRLDLNEAPAELIAVALGVSAVQAASFVDRRSGPDGIAHTEDDARVASVEEALSMLGMGGAEVMESMSPLVTVAGTTTRIESVGHAGGTSRGIAVVLRKDGHRPEMLEWREFVPEHRRALPSARF